jgi:hypothetical protein
MVAALWRAYEVALLVVAESDRSGKFAFGYRVFGEMSSFFFFLSSKNNL